MSDTQHTDADWLTRRDVMEFLQISRATLFRLQRADDTFPRPVCLGGSAKLQRWKRDALAAWLEARAQDAAVA